MLTQEVSFNPEMETVYQKYADGPEDDESRAEIVLGDRLYGKRVRMPKWNFPVSMLSDPKVAVKYAVSWNIPTSKNAHRQRTEYFEQLNRDYQQTYTDLVKHSFDAYGTHGPLISGIVRSHFPDDVKNRLRFLSRAVNMTASAARVHAQLSKSRSPLFK